MMRLSVFVVTAVLVLAGCGDDDPDDSGTSTAASSPASSSTAAESSPATTSSAPAPTQEADPAARRTLRAAQKAVVEADTGSIRTVVVLGPGRTETVARYELSSRSMQAESTITTPDDRLVTDSIAIGRDAWFRISREGEDAKQTCWIGADPAAIEESTGIDVSQGVRGYPAGVLVAVNASGQTQLDEGRVLGRVDLYSLAASFTGKLPVALGLDLDTKSTAPVVVQLESGVVTSWRSSLVDLLGAVEDAGLELPSDFQGYEDASLPDASVEAQLSELGTPVSISPPPADQVVPLVADADQFQQSMEACEARQG
jgi:hypothetical protein